MSNIFIFCAHTKCMTIMVYDLVTYIFIIKINRLNYKIIVIMSHRASRISSSFSFHIALVPANALYNIYDVSSRLIIPEARYLRKILFLTLNR